MIWVALHLFLIIDEQTGRPSHLIAELTEHTPDRISFAVLGGTLPGNAASDREADALEMTGRRRMEEQLRESESRYKSLFRIQSVCHQCHGSAGVHTVNECQSGAADRIQQGDPDAFQLL
ncbi:hypothetical protein ACFTAO_14035 [Paenibacillus rhizoplanae]